MKEIGLSSQNIIIFSYSRVLNKHSPTYVYYFFDFFVGAMVKPNPVILIYLLEVEATFTQGATFIVFPNFTGAISISPFCPTSYSIPEKQFTYSYGTANPRTSRVVVPLIFLLLLICQDMVPYRPRLLLFLL